MKLPRLLQAFAGALSICVLGLAANGCYPEMEPVLGPLLISNAHVAHAQTGQNCMFPNMRTSPVDPPQAHDGCAVLGYKDVLTNVTYQVEPSATHLLVETILDDGRKTLGYYDLQDGQPWGNEFQRYAGTGTLVELRCASRMQLWSDMADRGIDAKDYLFVQNPVGVRPSNRYASSNISVCPLVTTDPGGIDYSSFKGPVIGVFDSGTCGTLVMAFYHEPRLADTVDPKKMKFERTCDDRDGANTLAIHVSKGARYVDSSSFQARQLFYLPIANQPIIRPRIPQPAR